MSFIKLIRSEKTDELQENFPNAFLLLTLIAMRARRKKEPSLTGIQQGEALIGDYKKAGIDTEGKYRWALYILKKHGFITTRTTNKGTIAKLENCDVFDVNLEDQEQTEQHPNNEPTTSQQRLRRSKEIKENKEEEEGETNSPKGGKPQLASKVSYLHPTAPPTIYFSFEEGRFIGITKEKVYQWKELYFCLDIDREIAKATAWLIENPNRGSKGWISEKFMLDWLDRTVNTPDPDIKKRRYADDNCYD